MAGISVPVFISAFAFLAIFSFFIGIREYARQRTARRQLLKRIREPEGSQTPLNEKRKWHILEPFLNFANWLEERASSEKLSEDKVTKIKFLKAGFRSPGAPAIFYGIKIFLMICLPLSFLSGWFVFFRSLNFSSALLISALLAMAGFYAPEIWLRLKTEKRKAKIFEGLPDALDLLVVCVEAGMGLDAAINRVGQELDLSSEVLSHELKLYCLEMRAGNARPDALRNLSERVDIEDMNSLVTLLIQADKFGTSVSQALKVYSDSFRNKRFLAAEEKATKLPVKLMFPLIFFIFPALFVAIMGPAAIRIYQTLLQP